MASEFFFNMDSGYFEGLVRGFRSGILKQTDYINLCQCETLDGMFVLRKYPWEYSDSSSNEALGS
jgi:V-type H+-transporting ATPase subunit d